MSIFDDDSMTMSTMGSGENFGIVESPLGDNLLPSFSSAMSWPESFSESMEVAHHQWFPNYQPHADEDEHQSFMRKMKEAAALWNAKPGRPPDNDDSFLKKSEVKNDPDEIIPLRKPSNPEPSDRNPGSGGIGDSSGNGDTETDETGETETEETGETETDETGETETEEKESENGVPEQHERHDMPFVSLRNTQDERLPLRVPGTGEPGREVVIPGAGRRNPDYIPPNDDPSPDNGGNRGNSGNRGTETDETDKTESEEESENDISGQRGRHEQPNVPLPLEDDANPGLFSGLREWFTDLRDAIGNLIDNVRADLGGTKIQYEDTELTLREAVVVLTTRPAVTRAVEENAEIARKVANEWGESKKSEDKKPMGEHNGRTDAVRHALWSALNARDVGEKNARRFAKAHEADSDQPDAERQMDHHNNEVGIQIGLANPDASAGELLVLIDQAYENGELMREPDPAISPDRRTYPDSGAY